jgi:LytS/YehU family sensor histidine kinase
MYTILYDHTILVALFFILIRINIFFLVKCAAISLKFHVGCGMIIFQLFLLMSTYRGARGVLATSFFLSVKYGNLCSNAHLKTDFFGKFDRRIY